MMKRLLSILLCAGLLLSCVFPVFAKETDKKEAEETKNVLTIKTVEDFLEFAENCRLDSYSRDLTVSLEADISLYDTDFVDIPIFCGTFEGNGHTITELNLGGEGSYRGLFRYLTESAVVQNLAVQGNVKPTGSRSYVGGIAGSNAGKLKNVSLPVPFPAARMWVVWRASIPSPASSRAARWAVSFPAATLPAASREKTWA